MPRTAPQVRPTFDRSAPRQSATDRTLSAVAFALVLGSWCAAYTIVCPPEPAYHRAVQIAQVAR